jgi:hypothetical protein
MFTSTQTDRSFYEKMKSAWYTNKLTSIISGHLHGVLSLNFHGHSHVTDTLISDVVCDAMEIYKSENIATIYIS